MVTERKQLVLSNLFNQSYCSLQSIHFFKRTIPPTNNTVAIHYTIIIRLTKDIAATNNTLHNHNT